ncbi:MULTISPECIES: ceramidase domain-containing protein [unclassified Imperialibacter]|uniref:ceramidase domain-containing protein n=1 Tax=unclassified Imperialibacter TaxID=2629706 RepID=UPI0012580B60|nr:MULTISPECIES: ceramidase domain-containing protein [unclassified Imperialibacter]CAD5274785.1 conserved membrane hypothetical protein [Imperialibacter sp. 89]CAD5283287.1 conserved membrane hypothetical protein [Imperialibacter sp. 75]VVT22158.1 Ceramidase [Imperialibacter sp. EC-SDR9]
MQVIDLPNNTEHARYFASLPDGGPVYHEFHPEWIIVEPWNAISSLLILLPAVYWAFKLNKELKNYLFLAYCMPLLFLGGLGSTLFHAFRNSEFFLWLDVFPTAVLTISLSIYFWIKVLPKWWQIIYIIVPAAGIRYGMYFIVSPHTALNISYAITGTLLFLPILLLLNKIKYRYAGIIGASIALFVLALVFRELDAWKENALPMGTHFLWHISTGVGAFYLAEFLYRFRRLENLKGEIYLETAS